MCWYWSYEIYTLATDDLEMQRTRASEAMALVYLSKKILVSEADELLTFALFDTLLQ